MSDEKITEDNLKDDNILETFNLPFQSPVQPEMLGLDDTIRFHCHKGIACFNACCKNIDFTLTPYDILRLSRHLDIPTWQLMIRYTMPFEMDAHGMPGVKMRPVDGGTACQFVREEGCSVYADRPTACRYYAMGTMGMRRKDEDHMEDVYFMVREPHCLGHDEPRELTVREYRHEQGVEIYDDLNREWLDIIIKKRSAGPTVGAPSKRSLQLFSLAYDLDAFRMFFQGEGFQSMFELDADQNRRIREDDEELLRFVMRFLKQVLFGESSIPVKKGAAQQRWEERKDVILERQKAEAEKYRLRDPTGEEGEDTAGKP